MGPFIILFSLITVISVVISGALLLMRRYGGGRWRGQEHIQTSIFSFYTTLYAFFIGFAMVTLWSAFLAAKKTVTREAESLMIVYRIAENLPDSKAFRQALANYVKTVVDVEWAAMEKGTLSPEASQRLDEIWSNFWALKDHPNKTGELYANLTDASRQRTARATMFQGNLYPPVWMILIFGLISVIYGLYFINREPTMVSLIYEFMVIFLVLACVYFIYDIDTPFSGLINVQPEAFRTVYLKMLSLH